jgi:hypothetical protein
MKIMVVAATALSVIPVLVSLFMPNWHLGDKQNAVEEADVDGVIGGGEKHTSVEGKTFP